MFRAIPAMYLTFSRVFKYKYPVSGPQRGLGIGRTREGCTRCVPMAKASVLGMDWNFFGARALGKFRSISGTDVSLHTVELGAVLP